jgi:hypothetical protein
MELTEERALEEALPLLHCAKLMLKDPALSYG